MIESIYGFHGRINGAERMDANTRVGLCPANAVGTALVGRSGALVDAMAMICQPTIVPDTAAMKNPPPPARDFSQQRSLVIACPHHVGTSLVLPKGEIEWRDARSAPVRLLSVSVSGQTIHCSYGPILDRTDPKANWALETPFPAGTRCEVDKSVAGVRCYRLWADPAPPPTPPTDRQFIPPR